MSIRSINYKKWVGITILSLVVNLVIESISHAPSFSDLCRQTLLFWVAAWVGYEIGEHQATKKGAKHDCDLR